MAETEPSYCYRCGKHVRKGGGACWYCHAPIRRTVRPARRCRYCDEEIGPKALKCPHCGEFQDEGPSSRDLRLAQLQASVRGPQITYVIDKAVIHGDQPLMLHGGQPVPPNVSALLTERTARAIELNDPKLIDQRGVKALPAPAQTSQAAGSGDPEVIDVAPVGSAEMEPGSVHGGGALVRADANENLPALADGAAKPRSLFERMADFALSRFEEPPIEEEKPQTPPAAQSAPADTRPEIEYRNCSVCHTEVLALDNYCFHCGAKLRSESDRAPVPGSYSASESGNAGRYLLAIFFMIVAAALHVASSKFMGLGMERFESLFHVIGAVLLLATLPFLLSAFWRRRTSFNQLMILILTLVWLGCAWFTVLPLITKGAAQ